MYGRVKNGFVEEFCGDTLQYTTTENGSMYYIQIINPTEKEFNEAGFFRISREGAPVEEGGMY